MTAPDIAIPGIFMAFMVWAMDSLLLDDVIFKTAKRILEPVGAWICNLLNKEIPSQCSAKPFITSEYLARIERASLEILENRKRPDCTIILWWGLDGLKLNEDGSSEWVSRGKAENKQIRGRFGTIPAGTFENIVHCAGALSAMGQIDALQAQNVAAQMQMAQVVQNSNMIQALESCSVPCLQYLYSGTYYSRTGK